VMRIPFGLDRDRVSRGVAPTTDAESERELPRAA
jgi:hypothetical protein